MARSSRVKSGLGAGVAGPAAEFHQVRLQQSPAPGKFRAGTSVRVRAAAPRAGKLRPGAVAPAGGWGEGGSAGRCWAQEAESGGGGGSSSDDGRCRGRWSEAARRRRVRSVPAAAWDGRGREVSPSICPSVCAGRGGDAAAPTTPSRRRDPGAGAAV